tara:strand:- start:298 stop:498 length:201 start_codon:yes stop_codon:yes gene_type:complete
MKMTIQEAALKYTKARNKKKMFKLLDWIEEKPFGDAMGIPMICDITRVGEEGHHWAWDVCEEWQDL